MIASLGGVLVCGVRHVVWENGDLGRQFIGLDTGEAFSGETKSVVSILLCQVLSEGIRDELLHVSQRGCCRVWG